MIKDTLEEIIIRFRNKWGRFYYSERVGLDWEKPKTQNITEELPEGHDGFCIASGDMEDDIKKELLTSHISYLDEKIKEITDKIVFNKSAKGDFGLDYDIALGEIKSSLQKEKSQAEELLKGL